MTKIKIVFSTWMSIIICAFLVLSSHDSAQAIQPDTFNYPPINDPEQTAREEDQATSPLSLKLTGGAGLKTVTISGKTYTYYPIKAGETRVLVANRLSGRGKAGAIVLSSLSPDQTVTQQPSRGTV
jgi:hypothetical protein